MILKTKVNVSFQYIDLKKTGGTMNDDSSPSKKMLSGFVLLVIWI